MKYTKVHLGHQLESERHQHSTVTDDPGHQSQVPNNRPLLFDCFKMPSANSNSASVFAILPSFYVIILLLSLAGETHQKRNLTN